VTYALAILAIAVAFALWRRAFGGWLSLSRSALLAGSCAAIGLLGLWRMGLDWRVAIIVACWAWTWADGHKFDPPGKDLAYRYLAPMAVCAALTGIPLLTAVGPGVFASYWLAWRLWPTYRRGSFIDGAYAYAELGAGFWGGLIVSSAIITSVT
jgi:hypothetical protein